MKLQSKRKNTLVIVGIVAAALLVIALIAFLVVPAVVDALTKDEFSIVVSIAPKRDYYVGEKFDGTGLKIQVVTGDNESSYFVDYPNADLKITGFDSSVANESLPITITYKGVSTTMNVTIKDYPPAAPVLESVRLSDNFNGLQSFDYWNRFGPYRENVNLILTYSDGSTKEIPLKGEHCFNVVRPLAGGTNTTQFTIKYSEGGVVVEATITVTFNK